jgi:hypothetical protein
VATATTTKVVVAMVVAGDPPSSSDDNVPSRMKMAFPPRPRSMRGRADELTTLSGTVQAEGARLALVGPGGSGKSMLAAALAHRVAGKFPGGIHWFRIGAWDARTLFEMLALRFGTSRERKRLVPALRAHLRTRGRTLVVLDNHEDDRATAQVLDALTDGPTTFVVTARRCLLSGVLVYPVTAPLVTSGRAAFPRVALLTRRLRWNPLALDIADAIVASGAVTVSSLDEFLGKNGIDSVHVIEHEDDLPEVALLVAWAWPRLSREAHRILAVLAWVEGDHVDLRSVAELADVGRGTKRAIRALTEWHLVQEHFTGRFALHAVVRHAVRKRTTYEPRRFFEHYVVLLEREPDRLDVEQTHLFAAMDYAHRQSDLDAMLRLERLLVDRS